MALVAAAKDDGIDASHARSEVLKAVRSSLCVTPISPLAWLSLTAKPVESAAANGCSVVEAAVGGPQVPRSAQEVSKPSRVCVGASAGGLSHSDGCVSDLGLPLV